MRSLRRGPRAPLRRSRSFSTWRGSSTWRCRSQERVPRDLGAVEEEADDLVVGTDVDRLPDRVGRHRVGVGVEPDAGLLGDDDGRDEVGVEGPLRQGAQASALDEEPVRRALPGRGVEPQVGGLVAPACGLLAQVGEGGEGAAVEERLAQVADARLDASFGLRVAHRRGGGLEEVVAGEGEEAGIELHRRADVVQDDGLEIVVEAALGNAA